MHVPWNQGSGDLIKTYKELLLGNRMRHGMHCYGSGTARGIGVLEDGQNPQRPCPLHGMP
jgi:hypothetical protein